MNAGLVVRILKGFIPDIHNKSYSTKIGLE